MDWLAWIVAPVIVIAILSRLTSWLGYSGIAWGGADTDHPGWWLIRSETVYVRPIQTRAHSPLSPPSTKE